MLLRLRIGLPEGFQTSPKVIDYNYIEQHYNPTLSDRENAKNAGVSYLTFRKWRASKGYSSPIVVGRPELIKRDEFDKLYSDGLNDGEIASELDVQPITVYMYRKRHGIQTKYKAAISRKELETFDTEVVPEILDSEKPWKDPESLFCDGEFLEQFKKGEFEEGSH